MRHIVLALLAASAVGCTRTPRVVVWAWDRDEDLRFLEGRDAAVAYLAATIQLRGDRVHVRSRKTALRLAPETIQFPVVRIEADDGATLDERQRAIVRSVLRDVLGSSTRLQIDFEAKRSQRELYRLLLHELRAEVGERVTLSMTALASWCDGDRWMSELPVDEIVPMFYRLGPDGPAMREALARGRDLAPECRGAHGYITDEPLVRPPAPRRAYLFSPKPWSSAAFAHVLAALEAR